MNNRTLITAPPKRLRQINVEQQLLVAERDELEEAEIAYKKRIEKLEHEAADMLNNYDSLYNENKILRSKLEVTVTGVEGIESYNTVYKERQHMKEANRAFKRRIQQLEDDVANARKITSDLEAENKRLQQESGLEKEYANKAKDLEIKELQTSHFTLEDKVRMLLKEQRQFEYRISQMDKEHITLENKYHILANEKKDLDIKCDIFEKDREKLKDTISELEKNVIDPEQKAKDEQMFLTLQTQLISLQESNKEANLEIQDLKEEIRTLIKLKVDKENMIDRAISVMSNRAETENEKLHESELSEINSELNDQKQRCALLLKENDRLNETVSSLRSDLGKLELERKADSNLILQKEKAMAEMRNSINRGQGLNEDYDKVNAKYINAMDQKQLLEDKIYQEKQLAKEKIQKLKETIQENDRKLMEEKRRGDRFEKELRNLQSENDTMDKIIEGQRLELKNMTSQIEQLTSLLEDQTHKYENTKEGEKNAFAELRDTKIELQMVTKELEELKNEEKGKMNRLKAEMKAAKEDMNTETEQLKKESDGLKEEVKRLKNFEYKIAMMDGEIKKLMNRLRMADRFRKTLPPRPSIVENEKDEMGELKKTIRELEKDNMKLMQERQVWEKNYEKHSELQQYNSRLVEENKRVRRDLEESSYKIENLEKMSGRINTDDVKEYQQTQVAVFIDNRNRPKANRGSGKQKDTITETIKDLRADLGENFERLRRFNSPARNTVKRPSERKTTRTSFDITRMRSTKSSTPPNKMVQSSTLPLGKSETPSGMGYRELHKSRYKTKDTLPLL